MSNRQKIKASAAIALTGAIAATAITPSAAFEPEFVEVTNCNNSGAGSLRDTIASVNYGTYIEFDVECDTITLDSAIEIPTTLTILGPGSDELTIQNNETNNNGLFKVMTNVGVFTINRVRLTTENPENLIEENLIFSEGTTGFNLNSVEVTGVRTQPNVDVINTDGYVRFGESSFFDNYMAGSSLVDSSDVIYLANNSFVGNSLFEGSLVYSRGNSIAAINNGFVDNFPEDSTARGGAGLLFANGGVVKAYSNYFVEDFIDNASSIMEGDGSPIDMGSNYFAVDASLTNIHGVTNTTPGSGNSTIVTRADMKLGDFKRVDDPDNGLSPTHQHILAGSAAADAHTYDQVEAANNILATDFGSYLIVQYDGAGFRRGFNTLYDSGPLEYIPSEDVEVQQVKRSRNVFFNPMSAKLTKEAKASIRKMVNNLPDGAENVKVKLVGFVQPADFSWNNVSLSKARTKSVQKFMKKLGVEGTFKRYARGEDKDSTAKARRVQIIVKFDAPLS